MDHTYLPFTSLCSRSVAILFVFLVLLIRARTRHAHDVSRVLEGSRVPPWQRGTFAKEAATGEEEL